MKLWRKKIIAGVLIALLALGSLTAGAVDYSPYKLFLGEGGWHEKYNNLVDKAYDVCFILGLKQECLI